MNPCNDASAGDDESTGDNKEQRGRFERFVDEGGEDADCTDRPPAHEQSAARQVTQSSASGKTLCGAPPFLRGSRLTTTLTCGGLQSAETISAIAVAAR